jgi:hypothetical protein
MSTNVQVTRARMVPRATIFKIDTHARVLADGKEQIATKVTVTTQLFLVLILFSK